MGENKKIRHTDDFQIFCNVFIYTNRYRNDYKNPSFVKNNYTVAEINRKSAETRQRDKARKRQKEKKINQGNEAMR